MMHTQLMKYGILWIILFLVFTFNGFLGAQELKILALGDSLTEGYGVEKEEAYPHLLEEALREKGFSGIQVINAGISGSTSASAVSQIGRASCRERV